MSQDAPTQDAPSHADRFALRFDAEHYRRWIAGMDVIIHCHHYNSRIQHTLESAAAIDGKGIYVSSAEAVFAEHLRRAFSEDDDAHARREVAEQLYAHLGYGRLDLSQLDTGRVTSSSSHFVEGWRTGRAAVKEPICHLAEGYIQAAYAAITGGFAHVRETACRLEGAAQCEFHIDTTRETPLASYTKTPDIEIPVLAGEFVHSANVDENAIIEAVAGMPIHGDEEGLIPAFNVYLASTPADFYNLVSIRYIEEMDKVGLGEVARTQLTNDAEHCGMNTFRGIMSSAEWDALVAPMVQETSDNLFGVIAVSNALGWGNWRVVAHEPEESLTLASSNGYEAIGYAGLRGSASRPQCHMLKGVSAGIMELIYGDGPLEDRFGQFDAAEGSCLCCEASQCAFEVEVAA